MTQANTNLPPLPCPGCGEMFAAKLARDEHFLAKHPASECMLVDQVGRPYDQFGGFRQTVEKQVAAARGSALSNLSDPCKANAPAAPAPQSTMTSADVYTARRTQTSASAVIPGEDIYQRRARQARTFAAAAGVPRPDAKARPADPPAQNAVTDPDSVYAARARDVSKVREREAAGA